MELGDLLRRAQEAMDRGDYRVVSAACAHALDHAPSCVTAHRMMGESHLELRQFEPAMTHFARTIALDPLNVVARLGLGVAAEERDDLAGAHRQYLQAWELNPALDHLRDELIRLQRQLGSDERFHPTRAGLASILTRGGHVARAAGEWRAVLSIDPENARALVALADALWRQGDDDGALAAAEAALNQEPDNVRALALAAEITHRRNPDASQALIARYHTADPLGEAAQSLRVTRPRADLSFLFGAVCEVPDIDLDAITVSDEPMASEPTRDDSQTAPSANHVAVPLPPDRPLAPDLWDTVVSGLNGAHPAADTVPTSVKAAAADDPFADIMDLADDFAERSSVSHDEVNDSFDGIEPFAFPNEDGSKPVVEAPFGLLANAHSTAIATAMGGGTISEDELSGIMPFDPSDFGAAATESELESASHDTLESPANGRLIDADGGDAPDIDDLELLFRDSQPEATTASPSIETSELLSGVSDLDFTPVAETTMDDPVSEQPSESTSPEQAVETHEELAATADPFVTADGRIDLTVGWDDLDRELLEATPQDAILADFDGLLDDLSAEGITPIDVMELGGESDAWESFSADEWEEDGLSSDMNEDAPLRADETETSAETDAAPLAAESPADDGLPELEPFTWNDMADASEVSVDFSLDSFNLGGTALASDHTDTMEMPTGFDERAVDGEAMLTPFIAPSEEPTGELDADLAGVAPFGLDEPDLTTQIVTDPSAELDDVAPFSFEDLNAAVSTPATPVVIDDLTRPDFSDLDSTPAEPELIVEPEPLDAAASISANWDAIEDELRDAIPAQTPSGYTDILRNLDFEGFTPFDLDGDSEALGLSPETTPDAQGPAPVFDDLTAVTSRDGTAPLVSRAGGDHERRDANGTGDQTSTPHAKSRDADDAFGELASSGDLALDEHGHDGTPDDSLFPAGFDPELAASLAVTGNLAEDLDIDFTPTIELAGLSGLRSADVTDSRHTTPAMARPEATHATGRSGTDQWPSVFTEAEEPAVQPDGFGTLFGRMRTEKQSLMSLGLLRVTRHLASSAPDPHPSLTAVDIESVNSESVVPVEAPVEPSVQPTVVESLDASRVRVNGEANPTVRAVIVTRPEHTSLNELRPLLKGGPDELRSLVDQLEAAVAAGDDHPNLRRLLGNAYMKLGRSDEAARQFRAAIARRVWQ